MDTIDMYTIYDENNTLEPSKKTSKKVDLSKPTDTLNHIVKNQGMPMVYYNDNPLSTNVHKKVCLTKPNDKKDEKSKRAEMLLNRVILEEEFKTKFENNTKTDTKALKIILSTIMLAIVILMILTDCKIYLWLPILLTVQILRYL